MRIFAVSDIHGHYTEMKKALDNAGFDSEDPEHILVCCGDCFDRGTENRKVLEYLSSLKRKILIRGNHEDILENIIELRQIDSIDIYNGADITAAEFFGDCNIDRHGRINMSDCTETEKALIEFIDSMYDFYETGKHIFTHAWLPIVQGYDGPTLHPDRKYAENTLWRRSRYNEWYSAYEAGLTVDGKAIVCGHRASYNAYRIDPSRDPENHSIFSAPGIVAIDSATVRTRKVNVYVTEDEIPKTKTHSMSLKKKFFDLMRERKKTVEIRLFDKKRQTVSIGDTIKFSCAGANGEKITRRVVGLYRYDDIKSLLKDFRAEMLGYTISEIEHFADDISRIYAVPEIAQHGLLAIRLSHIM